MASPLFARQLSFGSLLDLSEKCEGPNGVRPRIAIIGAGITGVSTACHILDAGFECHIFEAGDESNIGGIWTKVNETSSLQIHSQFYTFHNAVTWESDYPKRKEILGQVQKLWDDYGLADRVTFGCKVTSTYQEEDGKWVINEPFNGHFDGMVAAVGTCGEAWSPSIASQDSFKGTVIHSSELTREVVEGKRVLIVGGGASAVEALEFACDNGAAFSKVLARSEKWFIPRHPLLNASLACCIPDRWGILSYIIEFFIRLFCYKEFWEMAPPSNGIDSFLSGTPVVNDRIFDLMRQGRASWLRGDVVSFVPDGIHFLRRSCGDSKGTLGDSFIEEGDTKASSKYQPPNWYMQCFPTEHSSVLATNATWLTGVGSVGGSHIGIFTRFLIVHLLDPRAAPSVRMMQLWVDALSFLKRPNPGGPLACMTSGEMFLWFLSAIVIQPALWPWMGFIISGPGPMVKQAMPSPKKVRRRSREHVWALAR